MMIDSLIDAIVRLRCPCVVGLDPVIEAMPPPFQANQHPGEAIFAFNTAIIDAICDVVPAVKPQIAFYEAYGREGIQAFADTVDYAHRAGLIVIEDGKRNDIGSTATAYARGHLASRTENRWSFDVDFLTVNPFLGEDSIAPFKAQCLKSGRGLFVLVKTSNPGAVDLQDLTLTGGDALYVRVAQLVQKMGGDCIGRYGYSSIGAVVGATFPHDAAALRERVPESYFLVPGFGAQGAKAADLVPFFRGDGLGAIISSSRGVLYAYGAQRYKAHFAQDFSGAARQAVLDMRDEIMGELEQSGRASAYRIQEREVGAIRG